jgi:hypothetical protein
MNAAMPTGGSIAKSIEEEGAKRVKTRVAQ